MDQAEENGPKSPDNVELGTQKGSVTGPIPEPELSNEPEENALAFNAFLMIPVLRCILKYVKTRDLGDLRATSVLWAQMTLQEMMIRASKGDYLQLGFDWTLNLNTINRFGPNFIWAGKSLSKFFDETRTCPRLYRSFYLNFPEAPLVLVQPDFSNFFEKYSPRFVELAVPAMLNFNFSDAAVKSLLRRFTSWMAPTVKVLTVTKAGYSLDLPSISDQDAFDRILMFPNLEKLVLGEADRDSSGSFYDSAAIAFASIFGQGDCQMPKLSSLQINCVDGTNLDNLFGVNTVDPSRWATLTSLKIDLRSYISLTNFVDGLLFLAESGMELEELALKIKLNDDFLFDDEVSGHLSQFLEMQAKSLKKLDLDFDIRDQDYEPEDEEEDDFLPSPIELPICPLLTSLELAGIYFRFVESDAEGFELFDMISLPVNFPKLERLTLSAHTKTVLSRNVEPEKRIHLKFFGFHCSVGSNWTEEDNQLLYESFSSIDLIKIY